MSLRGHRQGGAAQVHTERYLIVDMAGQQFALAADVVQGLLTLDESGSTETLTVQGEVYPPLGLAGRLGLAQAGDGLETRMVLVAQSGIRGCIRVDQVHGLVEVEPAQVLPLPGQFRGDERNWYVGLILVGETVAVGLRSGWLIGGGLPGSRRLVTQELRQPQLAHVVPGEKGVAC